MKLTVKTKCKPEIELYVSQDTKAIEERVEYQLERAEFNNQTVEFHYGHSVYIYDNRSVASNQEFSLLTIRKPKK